MIGRGDDGAGQVLPRQLGRGRERSAGQRRRVEPKAVVAIGCRDAEIAG